MTRSRSAAGMFLAEPDIMRRFAEKVGEATEDGCAPWLAHRKKTGYGVFSVNRRMQHAHRWLWTRLHGPVPAGHDVEHLCRHPWCVNPHHLEMVTHAENMRRRRGFNRKSHCVNGHLLDEANRYQSPKGKVNCRLCVRERQRLYRAKVIV